MAVAAFETGDGHADVDLIFSIDPSACSAQVTAGSDFLLTPVVELFLGSPEFGF